MKTMKTFSRRVTAILLSLVMLLTYLPAISLQVTADTTMLNVVEGSKKADPHTLDGWKDYFGPEKMDTEFAGAVWTDKSVFADEHTALPGVTLTDDNNFLVALSTIASNLTITGHSTTPTDTMLVLDVSGSMVDDTYEVGTIRQGNSYDEVNARDMSLINAMIDATNDTIDALMKQNVNNRVGVVLYSGNTDVDEDATPGTATVVLPLGRYAGVDGEYLAVDTTWVSQTLYEYRNGRWRSTGETATYVDEDTDVHVSVRNGLKTESGGNVTDSSKQVTGGTYIQNGLYKAMQQFEAVQDTTVPEGRVMAGAERLPVLVLMSDGAPTIATESYTNIGDSHVGNGASTNEKITMLTQLTAAYTRGRVAEHYQENDDDEADMLFLTLGLGTSSSTAATNTLYPAGSTQTLTSAWSTYLGTQSGQVKLNVQDGSITVNRNSAVKAMNYVDKYYYADDAQALIASFQEIFNEISIRAESYTTLIEESGADFSGYVTFEDELGELMQVTEVKGLQLGDSFFSGREIARGMTDGNLGTVDGPTERGDELIRTVRERIPGITTTQAQQLVDNAYNDQQLYYATDSSWSNFIGWYADANGNYVGFWDKDSGYDHAPAGAVYANRSYGYLGNQGDSDMMHVVVMVRTQLSTLHQTVVYKVPGALLPTLQYRVTLDKGDTSKVEKMTLEEADPMRLIFEVGLRKDINSVNMEAKIAEHIARGGHVHRNQDGTLTLYTNQFKIGNDQNGNGIPDSEEVDAAVVTQAHFHPSLDNTRFYYTDDAVITDANGAPYTGSSRPEGSGYYYDRYIYTQTARNTFRTPIAPVTLADAVYDSANGYWYVPAGTVYRNLARFQTPKTDNATGSLGYSFFPAVFDNVGKQDVYTFLGNNGTITVAPATGIALRKELQESIPGVETYTFRLSLSQVASPIVTDENGEGLTGVALTTISNREFMVTLPANVTAYISGIPVGTTVEIAEQIEGDYHVVAIEVAGKAQSVDAPAVATIPAYAADVAQMVPVVITNAPNTYGDLIVHKDVQHSLTHDPAALATKVFTFDVTLSGAKIVEGMTFDTSLGKQVVVGDNGLLAFADGSPISLHDEESITILRLPEGTAYTVSERDIPDGFALTGASGATGTIPANAAAEAGFVNTYPDEYQPVDAEMNVTVNKVLTGTPAEAETFTFVLQQLQPDNTYADVSTFSIRSDAANKVATGTVALHLDEVGTYYYRMVENHPDAPTPGMTYSTTRALFTVLVTDEDMDGRLEVAVREEAHVEVTAVYAEGSNAETLTDINVAATFTNVYEVHSTQVAVDVHKDLVNDTGVEIPLTEFHFGLYAVDGSGNATGQPIQTITTGALGDATFNIRVTENRDLTYIIKEIVPADARVGMTYDPAEYLVNIAVVAGADGQLAAVATVLRKGDEAAGATAAVFENTYALTPATSRFSFSKTLTGRPLAAGESFRFRLVRTDDVYQPLAASDAYAATYTVGAGQVNSGLVTIPLVWEDEVAGTYLLDKAGTYHFTLSEIAGNAPGVAYDGSVYHIAVDVVDGGNGALVAQQPIIHKLGQAKPVDSADFVNVYTVHGSGEAVFGGKKVLDGRALVAGEFAIGLYRDANCTDLIAQVRNRADGTFAFPAMTYTVEQLGAGNTAKTYTYYVKEIPNSLGGVTYDRTVHTVTVTVGHKDGRLVVTPSDNAATLQITNTYAAQPVNVVIPGRKVLVGDWSAVQDKNFAFNLYQADSNYAVTNNIPVERVTVNGAGDFRMALSYQDGQEAVYYYVLKEDVSRQLGGIGYDASEYHISVNVSDPGHGHLVAMVTLYHPGTGNAPVATFTNAYRVEPIQVQLTGKKNHKNAVTDAPIAMKEGEFSFVVQEGEDVVSTGYNLADGTIRFDAIRFTKAGVHNYTVSEVAGDAGGVNYDETLFTVQVTVTDNGDGTLSATTNYNGKPVAFNNTYTHEAAQVVINGDKNLEGDWSAVKEESQRFTFELYETGADFAVSGDAIDTAINDAEGKFSFGAQNYTTEGTHYYVVQEYVPADKHGILYDTESRYHITVVVEDDGKGNLIPTVTVRESGVTTTADVANSRLVRVDGLTFTNRYAPAAAWYTPEAQKVYEVDGDEMLTFDFVLMVDGDDKQEKQNDAEGKVVFDTLIFDEVGEYVVTIREKANALWGFIRWDVNVYTVKLYVEDDGLGRLYVNDEKTEITSDKGRDDLVFHNVHKDVIMDKDVFLAEDPTISIDGMTVEVGEELTYAIVYNNYDTVPVDVVIVDTIPAYTEYVDGTADNGGVYADGTITWELTVPAYDRVTVFFTVRIVSADGPIVNEAVTLDGENRFVSNVVSNPVEELEIPDEPDNPDEPEDPDDPDDPEVPEKPEKPVDPTIPVTGDNANLGLWFALMFVSGGLFGGTLLYGKKSKETEE